MEDTIKCALCDHYGKNLRLHIIKVHNISADQYKKYYGNFISDSVLKKRKETTFKNHGDPNYRNEPARKLKFSSYEGGHPLKDPTVRDKANKTKIKLYGDANYTNRDKAKKTCLEKYGVEYTGQIPELINQRIATLKEKYGKVFNVEGPCNKKDPPGSFKADYEAGINADSLCVKYNVSEPTLSRWIKELNLLKRDIVTKDRLIQTPLEVIEEYLNCCLTNNKSLSFYDYGKIKGTSYCTKIKRIFNTGRPYNSFLSELKKIALKPDIWPSFFEKIKIRSNHAICI
jgi:hypothetical protein